ncbi:hypothetical protein ACSBR1_034353 [Camellia fascicularis]
MAPKVSILPQVGFLFILCLWTAMAEPKSEYTKYKDPKQPLNIRIHDLMNRMTLAEKIGQMIQIEKANATHENLRDYAFGSILSAGGSVPRNEASAEDWVNMVNQFQRAEAASNILSQSVTIVLIGSSCCRDPELVKRIGVATALEVRATGIPYAFAPCIAVCRDPRWGRCYESYSEDHKIVQAMSEMVIGLQGENPNRKGVPYVGGKDKVLACAKHFVGDGGTVKGIDENNTVTDWHTLLSIHMPAYYNSIINGVGTIMVSYSSWNGVKMHANRDLVTGFLKDTLKFRGFVISDYQAIDKITTPVLANYTYSVEKGILAGIDMAHRDLAREAVRKSLVLLKNGNNGESPLLPLPKNAKSILVAGGHANNLGLQCGGTTILDAIKAAVSSNTQVVYEENPGGNFAESKNFDYAIVVVGEPPYAEFHGDNLNLTIPKPGPDTITNVCGSVKCVVVLISGQPLVIEPYLPSIHALVAAWLPGSEGKGVTDVLFGHYGFTGKLSQTWFKNVNQLPMNFGDPHYDPLFPFNFGLTNKPV